MRLKLALFALITHFFNMKRNLEWDYFTSFSVGKIKFFEEIFKISTKKFFNRLVFNVNQQLFILKINKKN